MDNVFCMHRLKSKRHLIQSPAAEVFRVISLAILDDFFQFTTLHLLEEDVNFIIVIVDIFDCDYLWTVQKFDQAAVVDNFLVFFILVGRFYQL